MNNYYIHHLAITIADLVHFSALWPPLRGSYIHGNELNLTECVAVCLCLCYRDAFLGTSLALREIRCNAVRFSDAVWVRVGFLGSFWGTLW